MHVCIFYLLFIYFYFYTFSGVFCVMPLTLNSVECIYKRDCASPVLDEVDGVVLSVVRQLARLAASVALALKFCSSLQPRLLRHTGTHRLCRSQQLPALER